MIKIGKKNIQMERTVRIKKSRKKRKNNNTKINKKKRRRKIFLNLFKF